MSLCELCKSIPLEGLQAYPSYEDLMTTLSGLAYFHQLYLRKKDLASIGFKHHPDLQSLRDAAAAGCGICRLIGTQVDGILADMENMDEGARKTYSQPQWDLWLTQLRSGRPGFMVLSSGGGRGIHPVAAIGLCAEEGDPLSVAFKGRPITEVPDKDVLDRVISWVKACDAHEGCKENARKGVPQRLIDVTLSKSGNTVQIVNTRSKMCDDRYVALSHAYKQRTLAGIDLLPVSQQSVDLADLPKCFRDAVAFTQSLGVKYLWIDEVCIPQEESQEWDRDSPNMGAVFANAYLTIAAAAAQDTSEGLFVPRSPHEYVRMDHKTADNVAGQLLASVLPLNKEVVEKYYIDMSTEPLSKDVWAFQDRVLSTRTLHFALDQIYLECPEALISENGLRLEFTGPCAVARFSHIPKDKEQALAAWRSTVWLYGYRFPANASDKLPALANVARAYADVLQDEYIAGLWKQTILQELGWQSLRRQDLDATSAPSWSWASFGGIPGVGVRDGLEWEPVATFLDHHLEFSGKDQFGDIKNAWIKLEAPLVPMELEESDKGGSICLKPTKGSGEAGFAGLDLINRKYSVSSEMIKGMEIYCLVLGVTRPTPKTLESCPDGSCRPSTTCRCILVAPSGDGESMKRIGFSLMGADKLEYEDPSLRTVVTLK